MQENPFASLIPLQSEITRSNSISSLGKTLCYRLLYNELER